MKINENDRIHFSNIVKKHNLKKEGFLSRFFTKTLSKSLSNDKSLSKAIVDGDKALDNLKKSVAIMKKKGIKIDGSLAQVLKRSGIKF
jgi:hypothetical protein